MLISPIINECIRSKNCILLRFFFKTSIVMSILPKVCSTSITERDSKKNDFVLKRNKRYHTGLFIFWTLSDNLLGLNRPISEMESIKITHVSNHISNPKADFNLCGFKIKK